MIFENVKKVTNGKNFQQFKGTVDGEIIYVSIWHFSNEKIDKDYIIEELKNVEAPEIDGNLSNIFEYNKYSKSLNSLNYSLYEYNTFYLGKSKKDTPNALKSAFIIQRENDWWIACESFDDSSMLTDNNINKIYNYADEHSEEISRLLNKEYWGIEVYN